MLPSIRNIVLTPSIEKRVNNIVRKYSGKIAIPKPVNCFQQSDGTVPCVVDDICGSIKDSYGNIVGLQATTANKPIIRGKIKNNLTYSNTFSHTDWVKTNITELSNVLTTTAVTNVHILINVSSIPTGTKTVQIDVKPITTSYVSLAIWSSALSGLSNNYFGDAYVRGVQFNLATKTIVNLPSYFIASIREVDNGFIRISVTYSAGFTSGAQLRLYFRETAAAVTSHSYLGTGEQVEVRNGQNTFELGESDIITTTSSAASSSYGPYWLDFDATDVLAIGSLSAYTSATVITSIKNTGQTTLTGQDISAGYNWNSTLSNGLILLPTTPSSNELAIMQKYMNKLAGVV